MKQQFAVSHTFLSNTVPELLESCVTNTLPVKMFCPQKRVPYILGKI
jgi:hypothetical protein